MPRAAGRAIVAVTLAAAALGRSAAADEASLDVVGACPDAAAVRRLLSELVSSGEAGAKAISIQDRGPQLRVAVGEAATMLDDPARDCDARARQAAVVV